MQKTASEIILVGILSASVVVCCGTTSNDKGVSVETNSVVGAQNEVGYPSDSSRGNKEEMIVTKLPDADWLKKDEPRKKIWENAAVDQNGGQRSGLMVRQTKSRVREIETSASSVFIYIDHKLIFPGEQSLKKRGETESPLVEISADGCPTKNPRYAGLVEYDGNKPSLIVLPRSDIPDGDIELRISAFGDISHVKLINYDGDLKVMTSRKQSRLYQDEGAAIKYPSRPGCPVEEYVEE